MGINEKGWREEWSENKSVGEKNVKLAERKQKRVYGDEYWILYSGFNNVVEHVKTLRLKWLVENVSRMLESTETKKMEKIKTGKPKWKWLNDHSRFENCRTGYIDYKTAT